jgi:hypothetical protein
MNPKEDAMRSAVYWVMLSLLLVSCGSFNFKHDHVSIGPEPDAVQRVAVFGFNFDRPEKGRIERGKIERPANAGEIVADIFAEHLLGTGLYQIVGKERIESIMLQSNLRPSDLLALSDWNRIRDLLGVDGVVLGVVSEYGDWRSRLNWGGVSIFTARLVGVSSGNVVWSLSVNRNTALVNAAAATHAGAESAVAKLDAAIRR